MVGPELQRNRQQLWLGGPGPSHSGSQDTIRNSTPARRAGPDSRWDCLEPLTRPATFPNHRLLPPPRCSSVSVCTAAELPSQGLRRPALGIYSRPEAIPCPHRLTSTQPRAHLCPPERPGEDSGKKSHVLTSRWCLLPKVPEFLGLQFDPSWDLNPDSQASAPCPCGARTSDAKVACMRQAPAPSDPFAHEATGQRQRSLGFS